METAPESEGRTEEQSPAGGGKKKRVRVGLCVGLGIGLSGFAFVLGAFAPCGFHGGMREPAAEAKLREFGAKLETYRMISGDYPSQEQGLAALVTRPDDLPDEARWKAQFRELPKDPWGQEYRYFYPTRGGTEGPETASAGADMVFGTEDDISAILTSLRGPQK
jgi:type II secretion system protein G